jgi:integrase
MLEEEKLHTRPGDLVFPSMKGTPMSANNLRRRYFQRHLKEAGLPKRTLHEMRHTYASIALHDWRLPPKIVQKLMGHENLKMTMDLYGHLMPGAEAEVMRQLNDLHRTPAHVPEKAENLLREAR